MSLRLSSSNSPTMISVWGGFPCNGLGWARRLYDCHSLPSYLEENFLFLWSSFGIVAFFR